MPNHARVFCSPRSPLTFSCLLDVIYKWCNMLIPFTLISYNFEMYRLSNETQYPCNTVWSHVAKCPSKKNKQKTCSPVRKIARKATSTALPTTAAPAKQTAPAAWAWLEACTLAAEEADGFPIQTQAKITSTDMALSSPIVLGGDHQITLFFSRVMGLHSLILYLASSQWHRPANSKNKLGQLAKQWGNIAISRKHHHSKRFLKLDSSNWAQSSNVWHLQWGHQEPMHFGALLTFQLNNHSIYLPAEKSLNQETNTSLSFSQHRSAASWEPKWTNKETSSSNQRQLVWTNKTV